MSPEIAAAIISLAANQQALSQHTAAMSSHAQSFLQVHTFPMPHSTPFHVPLIQQLTIPGINYSAKDFNQGQGAKVQVVVAVDGGAVAVIARHLLTT